MYVYLAIVVVVFAGDFVAGDRGGGQREERVAGGRVSLILENLLILLNVLCCLLLGALSFFLLWHWLSCLLFEMSHVFQVLGCFVG